MTDMTTRVADEQVASWANRVQAVEYDEDLTLVYAEALTLAYAYAEDWRQEGLEVTVYAADGSVVTSQDYG